MAKSPSGPIAVDVLKSAATGQSAASATSPAREMLKKPEFLERVVARTDVKKRDAKPAIEAALAVLSDALLAGEEVNIPPLGKLRVAKSRALDNGAHVLTLKYRSMKPTTASPDDTNESGDS